MDLNLLVDNRVNCLSILSDMSVSEYLEFVGVAYQQTGGIEGQRSPLKSSTAKRIRERMVDDLTKGAVLPPIVIGLVLNKDQFDSVRNMNDGDFLKLVKSIKQENVSIIDGMQRTTALLDAVSKSPELSKRTIRIEYWVTADVNSLIYRMLVLNTGQVPWNLRRQLEVVFKTMISEIKEYAPSVEVLTIDETRKRIKAGQFQANDLIELFFFFGARKTKIDTKEQLADEFTKLDFIEGTNNPSFTTIFYEILEYLAKFDLEFERHKADQAGAEGRFKGGNDLFKSQTVRIGFVTATAIKILGRPGLQFSETDQLDNWNEIRSSADSLLAKLKKLDPPAIGEFLDLGTLNELTSVKSGKVGEFEREFFTKAFEVLIETKFNLPNLTSCWRAY